MHTCDAFPFLPFPSHTRRYSLLDIRIHPPGQLILVLGRRITRILGLGILTRERRRPSVPLKELGRALVASHFHASQLIPLPLCSRTTSALPSHTPCCMREGVLTVEISCSSQKKYARPNSCASPSSPGTSICRTAHCSTWDSSLRSRSRSCWLPCASASRRWRARSTWARGPSWRRMLCTGDD